MTWLVPACLLTALAYATVGLAGGSTYLALMSQAGMKSDAMRVTALALNLIVSAGGFHQFVRAGHFQARLLVPFAVASIPAAFAAGLVPLSDRVFFGLLSVSLFFVAIRMIFWREPLLKSREVSWRLAWRWGPVVGAGLGALAGLVGIGGGIFLAPLLHLARWDGARRIAATTSLFILVNSLAGLVGQLAKNGPERFGEALGGALPLLVAVIVGGQLGSLLALKFLPERLIRWLTAALTIWAGSRLLLG